jgi:hypothetical protein
MAMILKGSVVHHHLTLAIPVALTLLHWRDLFCRAALGSPGSVIARRVPVHEKTLYTPESGAVRRKSLNRPLEHVAVFRLIPKKKPGRWRVSAAARTNGDH